MQPLRDTYLGQYHLIDVIRRGGMSMVYKAYQPSLERHVAIKVLLHTDDPQFVGRFKQEARAIAHLQHPNILPIYEYGEQDGLLYLVFQYIEHGRALNDMLGTPMPVVPALRLIERVLDALDYAHQRGIIHRDIKPANILMPSPTWPMLADFGIAKRLGDDQQLTLPGVVIGTAAYMAPEQAVGQAIDARTDLYSIGVVLFEMLAGRVPFGGDTPVAVLTKHVYEPLPALRSINPELPQIVEAALTPALEKDPAKRYQTAADMAGELERVRRVLAQTQSSQYTASEQPVPPAATSSDPTPSLQTMEVVEIVPPVAEPTSAPNSEPVPTATGSDRGTARPVSGPVVTDAPGTSNTEAPSIVGESQPSAGREPAAGADAVPLRQAPAPRTLWRRRMALAVGSSVVLVLAAAGALWGQMFFAGAQGTSPPASPEAEASARNVGAVRFHDQANILDEVTFAVTGLPQPPSGTRYEAWLIGKAAETRTSMGVLAPDADGNAELSYLDPNGTRLVSTFDSVEITAEPDPDSNPNPTGSVVYAGAIPPDALVHIKHLLVAFDKTPNQTGLVIGLLQQAQVLHEHAQAALQAQQAGDLASTKRHAEGIMNLVEGRNAERYGDRDGDGSVTDVGDGFGLLLNNENIGYIQGVLDHAALAADAGDATEGIKLHGSHVRAATTNLSEWAVQLRDLSERVTSAASVEAAGEDVRQLAALADRFLNGKDLDGNEEVDPIPGEGGALLAYEHAQYMADIVVFAQSVVGTAIPSDDAGQDTPSGELSGRAAAPTDPPDLPSAAVVETTAAASSPPPTPIPTPEGTLVFEDDFSQETILTGQTTLPSGLEDLVGDLQDPTIAFSRGIHSPGVYHIKLGQPATTRWEVLPRFAAGDFSMQIDLWDNSDSLSGTAALGVIFRVRDDDHFYTLLLNLRSGEYTVRKRDGPDRWVDLVPWNASPLINTGREQTNQVRVDATKDRFTIYLNGALLDSFQDDAYRFGMVGMIVENQDAPQPHAHFDQLKLWTRDAAPQVDQPAERQDSLGTLVLIPEGPFIVGSNDRSSERAHIVTLPSFYLDRSEVTNAAYRRCVEAQQCAPPQSPASYVRPNYANQPQYDNYPVINVTWQQAQAFCRWAGKRLPTEAEWEKAASWNAATGEKMIWAWGNTFEPTRLNSSEAEIGDTSAVDQFPPEINQTVGMAGNVYEWTSSLYQPYPYDAADGREDPEAGDERVFRGGAWSQSAAKARNASRQGAAPTYGGREIGFRCALTP